MYPRGDRLFLLMAFIITGLLSPVPCKSQVLTARFYPEKQMYFIGEPIFVFVEVTNSGELPVSIDGRYGVPCFAPEPIEVVGIKQKQFQKWDMCYGGSAGSCISGTRIVEPGKKVIHGVLLNKWFNIDHPGTYEVRTRRRIDIYSIPHLSGGLPIASLDVASEFKIVLTTGNEKQLMAAFEPYIQKTTSQAATSADPIVVQYYAEDAISALARTGDKAAIPVLKRIAEYGQVGYREIAVFGLGHFGENVIPFLTAILRESELDMQVAAIRGLGISASHSAVPILIELLHNSELQLAKEARLSLAELTHYSVDSNLWIQDIAPREYEMWNKWWQKHGATAEIYSTNNCSQPRPLPTD